MAEEREAGFPIEDFAGINRNVDREDITPLHLWSAQNLWERTLGVAETRWPAKKWGTLPTRISKVTGVTKLYKEDDDDARIGYVQCTSFSAADLTYDEDFSDLPAGIAVSFVTDSSAYWNADNTFGAVVWTGTTQNVWIRLVGYGYDKWYRQGTTSISGYAATTEQRLVVTISAAQDTNITGYEVYTQINTGTTATPEWTIMWVGYNSLRGVSSATHNFPYVPLGQSGTTPNGTEIGETKRQAVITGSSTGGGLICGKTYYVALLPHHIKVGSGSISTYEGIEMDRIPGDDIVAVTIPGTAGEAEGGIIISSISANTVTLLVCMGESPELLRPCFIYNNATVSDPLQITADSYNASVGYKSDSPGVVDIVPTYAGEATLQFRFSSFSLNDMLIRIEDDETFVPIFCGRMLYGGNESRSAGGDVVSNYNIGYHSDGESEIPTMGRGSRPAFKQVQNLMYFVNGFDPSKVTNESGYGFTPRSKTNYYMTDGHICAPVIEDYKPQSVNVTFTDAGDLVNYTNHGLSDGDTVTFTTITTTTGISINTRYYVTGATTNTFQVTGTPKGTALTLTTNGSGVAVFRTRINLPIFKYIELFQGSVVLAGGQGSLDWETNEAISAARDIYFSQALETYNFLIPGASVYQTVAAKDDAEEISGLGIYSNTTGDSGPFTQLIIGKKNRVYLLNSLPDATNGVLDPSVRVSTLSAKVGCAGHFMIENTPVGTVLVSNDNVYLLRENGEPSPIGQEISPILRGADLTYGHATYHDRHLKISFYHEDYDDTDLGSSINNVEFWLNINKMIEKKGQSDWVGPMIGYNNQYAFVEDRDGDGLQYSTARDRFCCDGYTARFFIADYQPEDEDYQLFDFDTNDIVSILETKDYEVSQQDNNWNKVLKRTYWKVRTNCPLVDPLEAIESTYVDGALYEEKNVEFYGNDDDETLFEDQPLKLNRIFPAGRPRGRTIRKKLETSQRIGIAGFQLNYQVEKRRI